MKKFLLKSTPLFFIAVIIFSAFAQKPVVTDFSGKWKLNEGKSELGQFAAFAVRGIETQQNEASISISRTAPSFDGADATTNEQLTFDGKEGESTSFGNAKKKAVAGWSEDGKTLTFTYSVVFEFDGQTNELKGKEIWTLADEGKTLVAKNTGSSTFGDFETKSVYEKQ